MLQVLWDNNAFECNAYISVLAVLRLATVCKQWAHVAHDDYVWHRLCAKRYLLEYHDFKVAGSWRKAFFELEVFNDILQ